MIQPSGDWTHQIKNGLGPLLNVLARGQQRLVAMIESGLANQHLSDQCTIVTHPDGNRLQVQTGTVINQIIVKTKKTPRGISKRVLFEPDSSAWVYSTQRTDDELIALQNALRTLLGFPPWDPDREPWSPMR